MKDFLLYTALRILLLVAVYAVLGGVWIIFRPVTSTVVIVILILAAVISSLLSLRLLAGPRERFAARVEERASRAVQAFEERKAREDVDVDSEG